MIKGTKIRKIAGQTGWLPFYNGSKFNKRVASKRTRKYYKDGDIVDFRNSEFYIRKYTELGDTTYYEVIQLPSKTSLVTSQSKVCFTGSYDQCLDYILTEDEVF